VDTSGEALARFVRRDPDLVRVNRVELVEALTLSSPRGAGHSLGVGWPGGKVPELALVSDGASPVRVWTRARGRALVTPPSVAVSNPIGCGDAMLAGLLARLVRGGTEDSAIAYGIAVGAAQAEARVPGQLDLARADELEHLVPAIRWSLGS
jgi:tagatose 6-phosphate kinase